jgi:hypothetical protein
VEGELSGFFIQNINLRSPYELSIPLKEIYTSDREIAGSLKFALGDESLKKAGLKISIGGKSTVISKLKGNLLEFGLSPKELKPGDQILSLELTVDGKIVKQSKVKIHILDSPFGF